MSLHLLTQPNKHSCPKVSAGGERDKIVTLSLVKLPLYFRMCFLISIYLYFVPGPEPKGSSMTRARAGLVTPAPAERAPFTRPPASTTRTALLNRRAK